MKQTASEGPLSSEKTMIRETESSECLQRDGMIQGLTDIATVVVLAVGLDPSLTTTQRSIWRSGGYVVSETESIKEAITCIHGGDFDLVLLGHRLPLQDRERLTFLIRSAGSLVPVVCVTNSPGQSDTFANATFENDADTLLSGIAEVLAETARKIPAVTPARQP